MLVGLRGCRSPFVGSLLRVGVCFATVVVAVVAVVVVVVFVVVVVVVIWFPEIFSCSF